MATIINEKLLNRARGTLIGLAVGDAIGTTLEFSSPGSFKPIDDMIGGGPFKLEAGQWTDDTSMALCLAESLIEQKKFDSINQLNKYLQWYLNGYLSSTGKCFDIGNTVRKALRQYMTTKEPYPGVDDFLSAGNGSIMRLAPIPLFYHNDIKNALEKAALSSKTTHATTTCIDACKYMSGIIWGSLHGASKEELLSPLYSPLKNYWKEISPLCSEIRQVAQGSFKKHEPPEIAGTGYVVKSLEAALWAFYKTSTFKDGVLKAANLGHDADTTAAIYGQIAGAYYGESNIPQEWRDKLWDYEKIKLFAEKLIKTKKED